MALSAFLAAGCARLEGPRPTLLPPGATVAPAAPTTTVAALRSPAVGLGGQLRLSDLPPGWSTVGDVPPIAVGPLMSQAADCLGVKLDALAGGALQNASPVFRSPDSKEWVTAAAGPAEALTHGLPSARDLRITLCTAAAVADGMTGRGLDDVAVRGITVVPTVSAAAERSFDLRVTVNAAVFGTPITDFVDVVWMARGPRAALLAIVDQSTAADLQTADDGLVAEATDAAARRIAGE